MSKKFEELFNYIQSLTIIDTHEHLPAFEDNREQGIDFLYEYLNHYFSSDLVSSGMPVEMLEEVRDSSKPLPERWKKVEPWWNNARNTGYGRALDLSVKILYGIPGINSATIEAVDEAFRKSLNPGHYRRVLKEYCRIHTSILHHDPDRKYRGGLVCDRDFYTPVFDVYEWVHPLSIESMKTGAKKYGISLHRLEDWEEACKRALDEACRTGIAGIKSLLAYERTLAYPRPSYAEAEQAFSEAIAKNISRETPRPAPSVLFENHMMHFICRIAEERGLTFQVHTGLQEGNGNCLAYSNPLLLTNLIHEYPELKFDLFHISYPWYMELAALAKQHQNVYIDMCWAHIISPQSSVLALSEYLDSVPANKISAFGGDYTFIDGVAGHLHIARENVARALDNKIELGIFDLDGAKDIAGKLFYSNPAALYGIM